MLHYEHEIIVAFILLRNFIVGVELNAPTEHESC